MYSHQEAQLVKEASTIILKQLAKGAKVRVPGFGEFRVAEVRYRDPKDGVMKTSQTVKFRPFASAKQAVKDTTIQKVEKRAPSRKSMATKVKPKPTPTPKVEPAKKSTALNFSLGGQKIGS